MKLENLMRKMYLKVSFTMEKNLTMTTEIVKVRVWPNLIASNLAVKPDELGNLPTGMLTNHVGNKQLVFKERAGDNVSSNKAGT